ncbi:MAG: hypothetical protein ACRELZ_11820 [Candidatus Rokuibacteriota bacterium]
MFLVTAAFAQPPAPRVTINGLFDQVTSMGRNFYDGNLPRDNDREWYARTRFRPDFTFEVGRVKAVLGLEIDLTYGQTGPNDGGFPGNTTGSSGGVAVVAPGNATTGCKNNSNGCLDLNTDVGAMIEIKWIYTEFPLTGKDSLMPFIPVETMARAGGQPWGTLANYKVVYANGDFAGLSTNTRFDPTVLLKLAYVVVEDQLAGGNRAAANTRTSRGEDWAITVSPEITPFKGLDIKPLYSYFHADGVTNAGSRHALINRRFVQNAAVSNTTNSSATLGGTAPAGDSTNQEDRHTIGIDMRWRSGPFGFDPTIMYQWGTVDHQAVRTNGQVGRVEADISAWIVDIIGSYQLGPLLLEARGVYTPGNKARDNLALGVRYFQPLSLDAGYWSGWAGILATGIDYFNGQLATNMGRHIGYDRYGRAGFGLRGTYSVTPALSVYSMVNPTWTAEKVDTDTGALPGTGAGSVSRTTVDDQSWVEGDSSYIGTEVDLGFTWRFAPNAAFDLQGSYLFAGAALGTAELVSGVHTRRDPKDAYQLAARVRLAF